MILLPREGKLAPAKVPGLAVSVADGAQWILDLDQRFAGLPMRPGPSLRAWSAAAKLLLELLGRGRILPRLRVDAGCLSAEWQMAPPDPADQERLSQLADALPDLCRAIVPPDLSHKGHRPPTALALLQGFLRAGGDALAESFLADTMRPFTEGADGAALRYWLLALCGEAPRDLPPGMPGTTELYAAVDAWTAPATGVRGVAGLRTGLRLNTPDKSISGRWEVELVLQTTAEPLLTIPAEAVWEALGQDLVIGPHRYANAEQRLVADLPVMARLYPPLARLTGEIGPEALTLTEAEVVAFLDQGAALLQEGGFPVLLPSSLVRTGGLTAKMHLKPTSNTETRFGLNQIVEVDWELALGSSTIDYFELERLAKEQSLLVQSQGAWIQVDPARLQQILANLKPYRKKVALGTALRLAARGLPTAKGEGETKPAKVEASSEGWVADVLERLQEPARIEPVALPTGLKATLRPYQERGFHWLAFLRQWGMGACLADDMGLGKTIQIITLLLHERETGLTQRPTLLVCPVSLVGNWRKELQRFAPSLRVLIHHGSGRAGEGEFAAQALAHDLVITTYALVARDETELASVDWAGVVADEAQNIKNPTAKHAQAIRRIPAGYRIAMTGTPVENHLGDLWSLFHFIAPGMLGGQEEFRKAFALPIERYHDQEAASKLKALVQPFMLRRLKTDPNIINDLPEKAEGAVFVTLTKEQAGLYAAVVEETMNKAAGLVGLQRHGAVLAGLTKLKQVCNHPAGLLGDAGPFEGRSGKLDRLTEMLEEVLAEGDSALIFTQFAEFGGRLREYLARRFGVGVLMLDGSTPRTERERLIERFQGGEAPLFVLSLKAGGVGLNLTRANHVFHFDRWWNPAVEDQATDRAYRIGQQRKVLVHKLVTSGTLEEKIDQLLTEKRLLSDQVVGTGEAWLTSLSTDELRRLIALEQE